MTPQKNITLGVEIEGIHAQGGLLPKGTSSVKNLISLLSNESISGYAIGYIDPNTCAVSKDGTKIGIVTNDGASNHHEGVGSAGSPDEATQNVFDLFMLMNDHLEGGFIDTQLGHVLSDTENLMKCEPAKNDDYYGGLFSAFVRYGKEFATKNFNERQELRNQHCEGTFPGSISYVLDELLPQHRVDTFGICDGTMTTGIHVHKSYETITETLDQCIAEAYIDGLLRKEMGNDFYNYYGKSGIRDQTFSSIVSMRYWLSNKSKSFLEKHLGYIPESSDQIPGSIKKMLLDEDLLLPELRVQEPFVAGFDDRVYTCRIYTMIEQLKEQKNPDRSNIVDHIIGLFFSEEVKSLVAKAYQANWSNEEFATALQNAQINPESIIKRHHIDIVLKYPGCLTIEDRGSDATVLPSYQDDFEGDFGGGLRFLLENIKRRILAKPSLDHILESSKDEVLSILRPSMPVGQEVH